MLYLFHNNHSPGDSAFAGKYIIIIIYKGLHCVVLRNRYVGVELRSLDLTGSRSKFSAP
jgi:hypothetical protein